MWKSSKIVSKHLNNINTIVLKIWETQPKWYWNINIETCIVSDDYRSFVDCCNFTNKAYSWPYVEIYGVKIYEQGNNYAILAIELQKQLQLFCLKSFVWVI